VEAGNVATEKEEAQKVATASLPLDFNVAAGCRRHHGFSMIEVLVAATIMIVIMLMLGTLFQQTSQAWRTGRQRADALQKARIFFGILQRDVSAAIDVNTLPTAMREAIQQDLGGLKQEFTTDNLSFFTLTGTGVDDINMNVNSPSLRALTHVYYGSDGAREETVLLPLSGGGFNNSTRARVTNFFKNQAGEELTNVKFEIFLRDASGSVASIPISSTEQYPAYISVYADVTATTNTWEIGAGSSGPDRIWDTDDDIKTWTNTN